MTTKPKLKDEESELREAVCGTTDVTHTQVEEGPLRDNDQCVNFESRNPEHDRERADSVRNTLPPLTQPKESSSTKEMGHIDSKSSNGNPQSSEQEKAQPGSAADASTRPRPLALSLLVIGISLSVFLVSLDRTIITTVGLSRRP